MAVGSNRKHWIFLFLLTIMLESSKSQTCTPTLINQAVYKGQSAIFTNEPPTPGCNWQYAASSEFITPTNVHDLTDDTGYLYPPYDGYYNISSTDLGIFTVTGDPIINSGNPNNLDSTAGIYVWNCDSCTTAANLIAVDNNGAVCACDPGSEMVNCTLSNAESTVQPNLPNMTWSDSSGNSYSPHLLSPSRNAYGYTSVSQLSITGAGASEYTCYVSFGAPDPQPYDFVATNAPTFTSSCSVANCVMIATTITTATTRAPITMTTQQTTTATTTPTTATAPTTTATIPATTTSVPTTTAQPTTSTTTIAAAPYCASQQLPNTVAYKGESTAFKRGGNRQFVQWLVVPSSDLSNNVYNITGDDGYVYPAFESAFAVNQSDLIILKATTAPEANASFSTAGIYTLNYENESRCLTAANLIVIQSGPVCGCDSSEPKNEKLTCGITFAESDIQPSYPIFTWIDGNGTQMSQSTPTPKKCGFVKCSVSELSVSGCGNASYVCQITFGSPSHFPLTYLTTVAPTFNATCRVGDKCLFNDFDGCLYNTTLGGAVCGKCVTEKMLCEDDVPNHLSCDEFCRRSDPKTIGSCEKSDQRRCPCLMQDYKACFCVNKGFHPDSEQQRPGRNMPPLHGCLS